MLSERSREALDDLLGTWSWAPELQPASQRPEADVFETLARDDEEEIAIWLCDERGLPAAMAEEIVRRHRRRAPR